ncbi:Uncharacterised protein [Enterobacter hormaechei]|nr:Uncharacterised protein [Enterobacter hormaechei]VAK94760.1 Uncharacterised protein [Enterobacter hormaechei]
MCCFQSFRCLIELLLAYFLRSQCGFQILNILLIAGVFTRFWQEFLGCGLRFECVGRIPFCSGVLAGLCDLGQSRALPKRLLGIKHGLLSAEFLS